MTTKNKVQLIGRMGMNPELNTLPTGTKMTKFSLAVNEGYKNSQGEFVKQTFWFNLVAWGKTAEAIVKNFEKGSEVAIEGKLQSHEYADKEGIKRRTIDILVSQIEKYESPEPKVAPVEFM